MTAACYPDLRFSQNYLKDPHLVADLISRSPLNADDVVYEIGPGKGIITLQLARLCKRVVAIEKDAALSAALQLKFARLPNLVIRHADFLSYPLPREPYKVFSNIPFGITSAIVARLTTAVNPPENACLVLQKEAASMYLGRPKESLRSILLKPWFELDIIHRFTRSDFSPRPHVDAVLLRISKRSPLLVAQCDRSLFRDFVVYCYTAWHTALEDTLETIFTYNQCKHIRRSVLISPDTVPTSLSLEQWLTLFEIFKTLGSAQANLAVSGCEKRLQRQQRKIHKIHRTRV